MIVKIMDKDAIFDDVAKRYVNFINSKPKCVLGLATGSTPVGLYQRLVRLNKEGKVTFKDVTTYNLDEYVGLDGAHDQSYRYFMNDNLFNHIDINKDNTHVLKGTGDYLKYMKGYDKLIKKDGGIDIQLLGIGSDGHIAFNEPGTSFRSLTHIATLAESTIEDNARFFKSKDEVPTKAVTMGLKSIMNAREIILIATGANKANAIKALLSGKVDKNWPCTILQKHKNCTIYCDREAYNAEK